jgi:predicted  nucleic acid-binding Zn-ribbon protein
MILAQESDLIRAVGDPGFQQWLIYAFIAFVLWDKITSRMERNKAQKREITGTVESREEKVPAMQADLDDIEIKLEGLRVHLDAKFREVMEAGQRRADAITARIDQEISAIRVDVQNRIDLVHEKVNAANLGVASHSAQLDDIKVTQHTHGNQISIIQQRMPRPRS